MEERLIDDRGSEDDFALGNKGLCFNPITRRKGGGGNPVGPTGVLVIRSQKHKKGDKKKPKMVAK